MMPTSGQTDVSAENYRQALTLIHEGRFREAIPLLNRSADDFRGHAAEGHPTELVFENGISALANVLIHLGICYERTGDLHRALNCFETALINERFERKRAFRLFQKELIPRLVSCYEQLIAENQRSFPDRGPQVPKVVDATCRFPFSLPSLVLPYARLFELDPSRYAKFKTFYEDARLRDDEQRSSGGPTDETVMRKVTFGVWGVLSVIWILYGIIVTRALLQH